MIVRPAEPEEYQEIYKVVDLAFKNSPLESKMIRITAFEDANFRKGDVKVVEIDGKIVSAVMIIRRPYRIGTAVVKGAMIAPLATHPEYEKRGCGSALMRDGVQYIKEQGFDIALLWGIPWLYTRYGYTPAIMNTEIILNSNQSLPEIERRFDCRRFTKADLKQMTDIYHNNTETRTIAELRSPEMWEWNPAGDDVKLDVVTDKDGEIIGYYSIGEDWGRPCAHEIGVKNEEAAGFIFHRLLERAKQKELPRFHCLGHPDHPFTRYAFSRGGSMVIRNGGSAGMVQVINLLSLLTKLEPEFERRLHHSEFVATDFTFSVRCGDDYALLSVKSGRVGVSEENIDAEYGLDISLDGLNPLITGYKKINELIGTHDTRVKGGERGIRLIDILFPPGYPTGGSPPIVWE